VDRVLQFYTQLYLQDDILVKTDRASMMRGLEVRAPFLDLGVVDVVRKIPWQWKYRNGETKYILKQIATEFLPHTIVYRQKKGFGMPVGDWFKRGVLEVKGVSLGSGFAMRAQTEHSQGKNDHRAFLWNSWLLDQWIKNRV
jgi:asparagine synthase (glutamine-hydrolysing)